MSDFYSVVWYSCNLVIIRNISLFLFCIIRSNKTYFNKLLLHHLKLIIWWYILCWGGIFHTEIAAAHLLWWFTVMAFYSFRYPNDFSINRRKEKSNSVWLFHVPGWICYAWEIVSSMTEQQFMNIKWDEKFPTLLFKTQIIFLWNKFIVKLE